MPKDDSKNIFGILSLTYDMKRGTGYSTCPELRRKKKLSHLIDLPRPPDRKERDREPNLEF